MFIHIVFPHCRSAECNCVKTPQLGGGITLDTSDTFDPHLYYMASSAVFRADISGCLCEEVFMPAKYGFGNLLIVLFVCVPTKYGMHYTVLAL